ncbi:DUF4143 domain-containing protein [Candidatus Saccharibacteria bacterium]|nr:DUF4143 domain-containing protein [Candidatus Saccharibacteria bacterium]
MQYLPRLIEKPLREALKISGGVFLQGVKASGKTETALRFAGSSVNLQNDPRNRLLAEVSPRDIIGGVTPRLIDEWQEVPSIWNNVKTEIDARKAKNQFILTGSATVKDGDKLHSGAGRIVTLGMSTLTWVELGYSNSSIRLNSLLDGRCMRPRQNPMELRTILSRLVVGGWPIVIGQPERSATIINRSYVDLLLSDDISRVSGVRRDRARAERIFRSIARNVATPVEISAISADTEIDTFRKTDLTVSRQATYDYMSDFTRLLMLVNQPTWNVHIRSSASLRMTPKRHLADTSLVCAALGLSSESLFHDLNFAGLLFESLVFHDMSVYAGLLDARVSYYRDSAGGEVDIIVERRDGAWAAFEVKLGDVDLDIAAEKLLRFAKNIDTKKSRAPSSLNIVTGTGVSYAREDGVNVISLGCLGV